MNTIRSTWYGWATLCVAGGGAYYFAKREINRDRQDRYNRERLQQERLHRLETAAYFDATPATTARKSKRKDEKVVSSSDEHSSAHKSIGLDHAGSPSTEASEDTAPVGHASTSSGDSVRERSKYEAVQPYKSRKGDRFS